MTKYHLARSVGTCAATGEPLEPGSACVATLSEREEDEGFDRLDYSVAAWQEGARPPRLFSYWRTVVPAPEERRRLLVDDQVLLDLFERLADDQRPQRVAFRFVLGLILLRKRKLKFAGRTGERGDQRWLLLRRPSEPGESPMEVVDPHLSDDDIRELTQQLSEVLQSEL